VLADGQTQDVGGAGQGKTVDADIVGDLVLLLENKVLELGGIQDLPGCRYTVLAQFLGN
jgi:ribosomal protein S12